MSACFKGGFSSSSEFELNNEEPTTVEIDGESYCGKSIKIKLGRVIVDGEIQRRNDRLFVRPVSVVVRNNVESVTTTSGNITVMNPTCAIKNVMTTFGNVITHGSVNAISTVNGDVLVRDNCTGPVVSMNGTVRVPSGAPQKGVLERPSESEKSTQQPLGRQQNTPSTNSNVSNPEKTPAPVHKHPVLPFAPPAPNPVQRSGSSLMTPSYSATWPVHGLPPHAQQQSYSRMSAQRVLGQQSSPLQKNNPMASQTDANPEKQWQPVMASEPSPDSSSTPAQSAKRRRLRSANAQNTKQASKKRKQ